MPCLDLQRYLIDGICWIQCVTSKMVGGGLYFFVFLTIISVGAGEMAQQL